MIDIKDFVEMFTTTCRLLYGAKIKVEHSSYGFDQIYFRVYLSTQYSFSEIGIPKHNKDSIQIRLWINYNEEQFNKIMDEIHELDSGMFKMFKCRGDNYFYYEIEIEKNQVNLEWYNELIKEEVS